MYTNRGLEGRRGLAFLFHIAFIRPRHERQRKEKNTKQFRAIWTATKHFSLRRKLFFGGLARRDEAGKARRIGRPAR